MVGRQRNSSNRFDRERTIAWKRLCKGLRETDRGPLRAPKLQPGESAANIARNAARTRLDVYDCAADITGQSGCKRRDLRLRAFSLTAVEPRLTVYHRMLGYLALTAASGLAEQLFTMLSRTKRCTASFSNRGCHAKEIRTGAVCTGNGKT